MALGCGEGFEVNFIWTSQWMTGTLALHTAYWLVICIGILNDEEWQWHICQLKKTHDVLQSLWKYYSQINCYSLPLYQVQNDRFYSCLLFLYHKNKTVLKHVKRQDSGLAFFAFFFNWKVTCAHHIGMYRHWKISVTVSNNFVCTTFLFASN